MPYPDEYTDQQPKMTYDEWLAVMKAEQALGPPDPYANQPGVVYGGAQIPEAPLGQLEQIAGGAGPEAGGIGAMLISILDKFLTPSRDYDPYAGTSAAQEQAAPQENSIADIGRLLTESLRPGENFPTPVAEDVPLGDGLANDAKYQLMNRDQILQDQMRRQGQ